MFTRRHRHVGRWFGGTIGTVATIVMIGAAATGTEGWLFLAMGVVIVGGSIWGIVVGARHRRLSDAHREFAKTHGWEYLARSFEFNHRFSGYPFGVGSARRQESVLRGTFNGHECATFAHVFEANRGPDGDSGTLHRFQVTLAELPVALPRIDIVPENLPAAVAKALGGGDVDVESYEFNQRWRVITNDPQYAHALLDPRMIERLLFPDVEGLGVRIDGGAVYVWSMGRRDISDLARRLGVVSGIARRIPDHVIRQYKDLGYEVHRGGAATRPLSGPEWAITPGVLTSGRYTGIGTDLDGDGIEDWKQLQ